MFEEFDFSKKNSPIPIVSQNDLTMFIVVMIVMLCGSHLMRT